MNEMKMLWAALAALVFLAFIVAISSFAEGGTDGVTALLFVWHWLVGAFLVIGVKSAESERAEVERAQGTWRQRFAAARSRSVPATSWVTIAVLLVPYYIMDFVMDVPRWEALGLLVVVVLSAVITFLPLFVALRRGLDPAFCFIFMALHFLELLLDWGFGTTFHEVDFLADDFPPVAVIGMVLDTLAIVVWVVTLIWAFRAKRETWGAGLTIREHVRRVFGG